MWKGKTGVCTCEKGKQACAHVERENKYVHLEKEKKKCPCGKGKQMCVHVERKRDVSVRKGEKNVCPLKNQCMFVCARLFLGGYCLSLFFCCPVGSIARIYCNFFFIF